MKNKIDQFFEEQFISPPVQSSILEKLDSFLLKQYEVGRLVALITSGGTSVPLEKNVVRTLENFSTGVRGALSAEEFMSMGYSVIYLHRKNCAVPYARVFAEKISRAVDFRFLESIEINERRDIVLRPSTTSQEDIDPSEPCIDALINYKMAMEDNTLLYIEFTTVHEYLFLLQMVSLRLKPFGRRAIAYLCAAVSDFYIPKSNMSEHKIQSDSAETDNFHLNLVAVPKCLGLLGTEWAPEMFRVSFKLETDPNLLLTKSRSAIALYGVHLVVANELKTRYKKVDLISESDTMHIHSNELDDNIEKQIVNEVAQCHFSYMASEVDGICDPAHLRNTMILCRKRIIRKKWKRRFRIVASYTLISSGFLLGIWVQKKLVGMINANRRLRNS